MSQPRKQKRQAGSSGTDVASRTGSSSTPSALASSSRIDSRSTKDSGPASIGQQQHPTQQQHPARLPRAHESPRRYQNEPSIPLKPMALVASSSQRPVLAQSQNEPGSKITRRAPQGPARPQAVYNQILSSYFDAAAEPQDTLDKVAKRTSERPKETVGRSGPVIASHWHGRAALGGNGGQKRGYTCCPIL